MLKIIRTRNKNVRWNQLIEIYNIMSERSCCIRFVIVRERVVSAEAQTRTNEPKIRVLFQTWKTIRKLSQQRWITTECDWWNQIRPIRMWLCRRARPTGRRTGARWATGAAAGAAPSAATGTATRRTSPAAPTPRPVRWRARTTRRPCPTPNSDPTPTTSPSIRPFSRTDRSSLPQVFIKKNFFFFFHFFFINIFFFFFFFFNFKN